MASYLFYYSIQVLIMWIFSHDEPRAFPNTNNCVPLYPFDLNLFSLIHQSLNTERDLVIAFNIRRQVKVAVSISSIDLMTVAHERNPHQVDL